MPQEHILVNDIIADHKERMLNLRKYYPFFKLSEVSFSWFKDGIYDNLDMGYILMAVLRFFIEENNFKERDVTYQMYYDFMSACIRRDFAVTLTPEDNKVLVDYIFDKLKNDGRPFMFEYYDPVDRVRRVLRVKLLESRIQDGTVWYSISPDGIEFYLETKEIKDESRINVEQLLLEKMIESEDFKGGTEVVKRINEEVERLKLRRNKVLDILSEDVFAGVDAYENFFDTGIRWFADEQKLFAKNRELIESAMSRFGDADDGRSSKAAEQIYRLDTELKIAMNNHSELLKACTELGIRTDEIVRKAKLGRLRSRFDFKGALDIMIKKDMPQALEYVVKPFLGLNIHKTFDLVKVEDILSYRPYEAETPEQIEEETAAEIVFEDELDDERFRRNAGALMHVLLEMLTKNDEFTLGEYNDAVMNIFGSEVFKNGDYYAFLVHLCGKKDYFMQAGENTGETFLDEIIAGLMDREEFLKYSGMHFILELADGNLHEIIPYTGMSITDFTIKRI